MNNKNADVYSEVFTNVIITHAKSAFASLGETSFFRDLSENDWKVVIKEFVLFNIHFCDRMLFSWYDVEFRNEVFDKIIIHIGTTLDESREKLLDNKLNSITMESFGEYLGALRDDLITPDWLLREFNQRTREYGQYEIKGADENGLAGSLFLEFGKKVASLIGRDRDGIIISLISFSVSTFIDAMSSAKKLLDIKAKNKTVD